VNTERSRDVETEKDSHSQVETERTNEAEPRRGKESRIASLTALGHNPHREELFHLHRRPNRAPAEIEDTRLLVLGKVGSVGCGECHCGDVAE
jgi:hypothetical protein